MKEFSSFLTPPAEKVFISLSGLELVNNFTLVGGTGLAFHLKHRLSEDLDYFSWLPTLDKAGIDPILKQLSQKHSLEIINKYANGIDILLDNVKVTFFANNWEELKRRKKLYSFSFVADIELLTAMKVNTLSLRAKYRDYYDLYIIAKEVYEVQKIFEISVNLIPGMTKKIFAMQLTYIEDITDENIDHLTPKYRITLDDIRKYFEKETAKILSL